MLVPIWIILVPRVALQVPRLYLRFVSDPLGLDESQVGNNRIDPGPPIRFDGGSEMDIAKAIARQADAMAELAKLLPLPVEVSERFQRSIFDAWTQLIEDTKICQANHAHADELELSNDD